MKFFPASVFVAILLLSFFGFAMKASIRSIPYSSQSGEIYRQLAWGKDSLKKEVFELAVKGLETGIQKNIFEKSSVLTIVDMSRSANARRMYIIDMDRRILLFHTYVAHGRNSGEEFARAFSNEPQSLMSSMGFYKTQETYFGLNGLGLRLEGLEKGYNDKAREREIVIHGADYADEGFIKKYRTLGRSWGCPAVPMKLHKDIIETIKDGSCLFIYYPEESYLRQSSFLNPAN